jgi:PPK2 family polyphosphate:nucleotide phosphotransferase
MKQFMIEPGKKIQLAALNPEEKGEWKGRKEEGIARIAKLRLELDALQSILYAESKHKVLMVLQAMDTAGKDGTIRSVFEGINPVGVRVASFKVPTSLELSHDVLWRIHAQAPANGELVVFNRSHYEDVLVVRVHGFQPEERWRKHYQQFKDFERMLTDEGTLILKFFLFIDQAEQKKRLLERIDTPEKQWKFSPGDLEERKFWPAYMQAYEEMLNETSTDYAPWYVIPSNDNWFRNMAVAEILVNGLKGLNLKYPAPAPNLAECRAQLEAEK